RLQAPVHVKQQLRRLSALRQRRHEAARSLPFYQRSKKPSRSHQQQSIIRLSGRPSAAIESALCGVRS
ncbi:hypothetical protein Dimus_014977, partial [Dionaea muscipula]